MARRSVGKWIWPVTRFWTFSPQGWVLAVIWNCYEYAGKPMPWHDKAFGVIMCNKGKRIK